MHSSYLINKQQILHKMQRKRNNDNVDLVDRFKPTLEADLAIHVKKIEEVKQWLTATRKLNPASQVLLLTGPSGSGKSVCVKTIARAMKYDVREWTTPVDVDLFLDDRYDFEEREGKASRRPQKALFDDFLYKTSRYCSLFETVGNAGKLLLVKDFPNSLLRSPEEFHESLTRFLDNSSDPIVFIATDTASKSLDVAYNLFPPSIMDSFQIHQIKFNPVSSSLLKKAIKRISGIIKGDNELSKLYQAIPVKAEEDDIIASAQGDLRNCCLNYLFTCMKSPSGPTPKRLCPENSKGNKTAKAKKSVNSLGLSENLTVMHGLGRIFHPKFISQDADMRFVHSPESIAESFLSQPSSFISLLHSNYVTRCADIQNVSKASDILTTVDAIMNEFRSEQLALCGLNIAIRSMMVNNEQTVHGFQPIKKKIKVELQQSKIVISCYIPQIVIQGFKSYSKKTVVEQLDPKHNVVVGRNGSGKSNFFSAIEFVLSDEYNNLRPAQRVALMNKGSGSASAFVEIVFETKLKPGQNSASVNRFRVRRTITHTNDQFTLNGRNVARKEVAEFLESCGLSNSSPYYIVKQGKINQLAVARPRQLLEVLFEIAGIRVYNEKRREALKLLQNADELMMQVRTERATIATKLQQLSRERKEQEKFLHLDKKHRVLQFLLLERSQQNAIDTLDALGREGQEWQEKYRLLLQQKAEAHERMQVLKRERKLNATEQATTVARQSELREQLMRLEQKITQLELDLEDMCRERNRNVLQIQEDRAELDHLNETIANRQNELDAVSRKYGKLRERENAIKSKLLWKEQKRGEMLDKLRRSVQFGSRAERDRWLTTEIEYVRKQIEVKKDAQEKTRQKRDEISRTLKEEIDANGREEHELKELQEQLEIYQQNLANVKKYHHQGKELLEQLLDNEVSRKRELERCKTERLQHEQTIRKHTGSAMYKGWRSVLKVLDILRAQEGNQNHHVLQGYYGRVLENFSCDESLHNAVETAAGNKLYYHIVESEIVAKAIITLCNLHKLPGEFNFMPLNRLELKSNLPEDNSDSVVSLISLLTFDRKYDTVFRQIFGRTLLCDSLEQAIDANKRYAVCCVTRDGDVVRSGVITGGYRRPASGNLFHQPLLSEQEKCIAQLEADLKSDADKVQRAEKFINERAMELTAIETKLQRLLPAVESMQVRSRTYPVRRRMLEEELVENGSKISTVQTELELLTAKLCGLERELATELVAGVLSEDEQRQIEQLDDEIRQIRQELQELFEECLIVSKDKKKRENVLTANLIPKRDSLVPALELLGVADVTKQLEICQRELESLNNQSAKMLKDIENIEQSILKATKTDKKLAKELASWEQMLKSVEDAIAAGDPVQMSYEARRRDLEDQIEQYGEQIQAIGTLPAVDRSYLSMPLVKLMKEVASTNKQLQKYSNVNKKAIDQYTKMWQQCKEMDRCLQELQEVRPEIDRTLQQLEAQRVECIQTTFDAVNRNFSEIFCKFVPNGCGRLILQTIDRDAPAIKSKSNTNNTDDSADSDKYVGLGLEVSFVGRKSLMSQMNQLSGGQKTLVAIALIFAIQMYNPSPFYLFDEIDQALDSQHRAAVANMIQELSNNSQFLTITFRRELLEHAHKFYGVRCHNKVSHIAPVPKQKAYEFVVNDAVYR
uniref:SMC hinge domain-containing protein n=1 Tax=Anopheles farauti TaxID=69004 RepID=A0A182QA32_9DIPT